MWAAGAEPASHQATPLRIMIRRRCTLPLSPPKHAKKHASEQLCTLASEREGFPAFELFTSSLTTALYTTYAPSISTLLTPHMHGTVALHYLFACILSLSRV